MAGEGGHQRCQRSIGLQAQRRLQSGLATEVRPPGPAVHTRPVHVAVGVDRNPLARCPFRDVAPDFHDPAGGLVSENAVAPVHLRQLRSVQIAAANAAQIDFDQYLIRPQPRAWPVLQRNPPLFGKHHCGHRHLQRAPCRFVTA